MFHPNGPTFFELAKQALSSTQQGYDLLAPKFDFTPFRTPDVIFDAVKSYLENEDWKNKSALDLCCGTGAAMQMCLDLGCSTVTGIDFSAGMLGVAKQNLKKQDAEQQIQLIEGEVLEPRFENEFDLVVSFGAFGHILPRDERKFVETIHRALKPGGKFVFVTTTMFPLWSPTYLFSRSFNAAMRIRNLLFRPKFIMYYLTFLWPDIESHFEAVGLKAVAQPLFPDLPRRKRLLYVEATK